MDTKSKGMLVQAKREKSLLNNRGERLRLADQCRKMRKRTDDAYIWVFDDHGVRAVQAPKHAVAPEPNGSLRHWPMTPGELVTDALRCRRGDEEIGIDPFLPLHETMNDMVARLGAPNWASVRLTDD